MFIRCHRCGWDQDDFWDGKYHPLNEEFIQELRKWLAEEKKELVSSELIRMARHISQMKWETLRDFLETPEAEKICPRCGAINQWAVD